MNSPAETGGGHDLLADLASALRRLRQRAGSPPYKRMSFDTYCSVATLSRADKGDKLPAKDVVLAYVQACGGDTDFWSSQYDDIKLAIRDGTHVEVDPWTGFEGPVAERVSMFGPAPRAGAAAGDEDFLESYGKRSDEILRIEHEYVYGSRQETGWLKAYATLLTFATGRQPELDLDATIGVTEYATEMRRIRRNSGLSLTEIAARTRSLEEPESDGSTQKGISKSAISDLCNPACTRLPSPRTVRLFLKALGADLDNVAYWLELRDNIAQAHLLRYRELLIRNLVVERRVRHRALGLTPGPRNRHWHHSTRM